YRDARLRCGWQRDRDARAQRRVQGVVAATWIVTASSLRKKDPETSLRLLHCGSGTTRAAISDSITEGNALWGRVHDILSREFHPHTRQAKKGSEKPMKKLLLITLAIGGLALMPAQHSEAQVTVLVPRTEGLSFGFPSGYYGSPTYLNYYPYGYYRHPY